MLKNFNAARIAASFSGEYFGYLEFPDFGEVMICPLNNAVFLLYLCNIWVADFQSSLLQNIILDFLIDFFTPRRVRSSSFISNATLIFFN